MVFMTASAPWWLLDGVLGPTPRGQTAAGTDQILLGQLYRWRGSFEYEYESAVNTHGWCYVAGFAGPQIRPGSCKAAWSVPRGGCLDRPRIALQIRRFTPLLEVVGPTEARPTPR